MAIEASTLGMVLITLDTILTWTLAPGGIAISAGLGVGPLGSQVKSESHTPLTSIQVDGRIFPLTVCVESLQLEESDDGLSNPC